MEYVEITGLLRYAPWKDDVYFMGLYEKVKENTMMYITHQDFSKLYTLWLLSKQCSSLEGDMIEVGVWKGGTGFLIAEGSANKTVYLCDTFAGVVNASSKDGTYVGGEHSDCNENDVIKLLEKNKVTNCKILKGIFPEETSSKIVSEKISLCHIDVDVYLSAKRTFEWVFPKLVHNAVVVFDDYGFQQTNGVTLFVNEILKTLDCFYFYNINGQLIIIKK